MAKICLLETKQGQEKVLEYLATLKQQLAKFEQEFGESLDKFCNQDVVESNQIMVLNGEPLLYVDLAQTIRLLHYCQPAMCEHALRRPTPENADLIRRLIKSLLVILERLEIPHPGPDEEIMNWLRE